MNELKSIFNIQIDETVQFNLKEAAKWARFLSVVGIVITSLFILLGIGMMVVSILNIGGVQNLLPFGIVYLIISLLNLYPIITFYKFGKGIKNSLLNNNQNDFSDALHNLTNCFKFIGIITAITIIFYIVIFIFAIFANGQDWFQF